MKFIMLNTFMKQKGMANTGGMAKQIIRSELVKVNNEIETRNKKKLIPGDVVEFENTKIEVKEDDIRV